MTDAKRKREQHGNALSAEDQQQILRSSDNDRELRDELLTIQGP